MNPNLRRTKIVATIGPASETPEVLRALLTAGMDVARLNLSHGTHEDHAQTIAHLRAIAEELASPVTILLDLQGPKVRVGQLLGGEMTLIRGETISLVPEGEFSGDPATVPIDYPHAAEEAKPGMQVLLADGLFELQVVEIVGRALHCRVVEGGVLKSRKGVNFPELNLRLPSMTEKDHRDLEFGIAQNVDWISLSFVRSGADVRELKNQLAAKGARQPVIAKFEKPQAIEHLDEILAEVDGVMVARGDLGVELSPERVPMLQKLIIEQCNRRGIPVITATQMLESMIHDPRPTRAEASDVANAIIDGTDAVMLSGESAVGAFPVRAVEMMARIAREVESRIAFTSYPPTDQSAAHALSAAASSIAKIIHPRCIAVLTTSGHTARAVASTRTKIPIAALTTDPAVYHTLNLVWGIHPFLIATTPGTFEGLIEQAESTLREQQLASTGDQILVLGCVPPGQPHGGNFVKIHTVS
ncbi:MAG: pyruvate kinase [Chthoniobacteraceae bacterium]